MGGKALSPGMNVPLLPGAHHINLELLVLHEKPLEKKIKRVEEEQKPRDQAGEDEVLQTSSGGGCPARATSHNPV